MLSDFTATANAVARTTRKLEKERILADYLAGLDDASLERAAVFFTGSPFPRREQRVTGVGAAAIVQAASIATGRPASELQEAWASLADLGDSVAELVGRGDEAAVSPRPVTLSETGDFFDRLAACQGSTAKTALLASFLRRLDADEARYVVKMLQGEMRIGLQEGLVEAAIARAFGRSLEEVRRANMFTGDIGLAALLARSDTLGTAKMSLFHPFAFMLAQPMEDPAEIVAALGAGALADDKYDGIRAQIHTDGSRVAIFSRTLDDVTHRFPELEEAARLLGGPAILDGEIVAFDDRILPFAAIQKRLGRRVVSEKLRREVPVAFFAFDLLYDGGEALFETPLEDRLGRLRALLAAAGPAGRLRLADQAVVHDASQLDALFDAARARANEGLVIKDPSSAYTPGRRGRSWLKYKKALATLDCVVTFAQYGNGKRRGVLSDLTFAVSRDGELVNVGKAFTGLTDAEIAAMTERFKASGEWLGWGFRIPPGVVLEIAFDRIQESRRHKSGYALRFPRIVRIRDDKGVDGISTIDDLRRIYDGQLVREGRRD